MYKKANELQSEVTPIKDLLLILKDTTRDLIAEEAEPKESLAELAERKGRRLIYSITIFKTGDFDGYTKIGDIEKITESARAWLNEQKDKEE